MQLSFMFWRLQLNVSSSADKLPTTRNILESASTCKLIKKPVAVSISSGITLRLIECVFNCRRHVTAGDVSFSDIVGCDLDMLRHGGAYARLKDGANGNGCGRQKRLRTSFKHHQLRSMKAYFALNHNPDAKDLKELAQKTGLTKRVLQVSSLLCIYDTRCCFAPCV